MNDGKTRAFIPNGCLFPFLRRRNFGFWAEGSGAVKPQGPNPTDNTRGHAALGEISFPSSFPPCRGALQRPALIPPSTPSIFFPIQMFWKQSTLFQMRLSCLEEDYGVLGITPSYSRMRSVTQGVNRGLC